MTVPFTSIPLIHLNSANQSLINATVPVITNATSAGTQLHGATGLMLAFITKSGAAAGVATRSYNAPEIHGIVNTISADLENVNKLVLEDIVTGTVTALACELVFGFFAYNGITTAGLCGVGFKATSTHEWVAFIRQAPLDAVPSAVVRETATGQFSNVAHRLTIVLDSETKTIEWYIDGVLRDSYTVPALTPIDKMGATMLIGAGICIPANGNAVLYNQGGTVPQLRLATKALIPIPGGGGGTSIHVSIT